MSNIIMHCRHHSGTRRSCLCPQALQYVRSRLILVLSKYTWDKVARERGIIIRSILEAASMCSMTSGQQPCLRFRSVRACSLGQRITGEFAISFDFNELKYIGLLFFRLELMVVRLVFPIRKNFQQIDFSPSSGYEYIRYKYTLSSPMHL